MDNSAQFAQKSVLGAAASAFIILGSFASSVIAARLLGLSASGQVAYIIWLMSIGAVLFDFGLSAVILRYIPELRARGNVAQADALATSVVRMLLVIIGALGALTLFCLHFRLWPDWLRNVGLDGSTILSLLVTYISVQLLAACAQVYLRGRQDFANLAKLCAASFALQLVAVTVGGLLLRIEGIIVGYIVGQIPLAAVALRLMTKSGRIDKSLSSRIRRYGLYSWAANIGSAVVWARIEIFFLQQFWNSDAVGLFAAALTFANLAAQGPILLTSAFLPLLSERYGTNDRLGMSRIFSTGTRLLAVLLFPACLGMAALMPVLIPLIYGPDFSPAVVPGIVLVCAAAFTASSAIGTNLVSALERSDFLFGSTLVGALLAVALELLLVPRFGILGATTARASVQVIMIAFGFWFVQCRLGYALPLRALIRIAAASLAPAGIAALCIVSLPSAAGLLVAVPAAGVAYVLALRALKAIPSQDLAIITAVSGSLPKRVKIISQYVTGFVQRA